MGDNREHSWTDERVALLITHFDQNLPASASAKILGVTRNAVIGKRQRLGLNVDPHVQRSNHLAGLARSKPPAVRQTAPRQTVPPRVRTFDVGPAEPPAVEAAPAAPVVQLPVPAAARSMRICDPGFGGCRWPISGDGADILFCCAPKKPGGFWCVEHAALGYSGKELKPLKVGMAA